MVEKKRVFSGVQPSGRLHIGNYVGAIMNWVTMQDEYLCIFGIVDYHAMTVRFEPKEMEQWIFNAAVDYLAAGIDHKKSILMVQSTVSEHTELAWVLNTVTPVGWLSRSPTYKEKQKANPDYVHMGLFDYPVLMAADIILYKAEVVPVGDDQVAHLELTREIVRRFNSYFGDTFPEPKAKLGEVPRILGLDGVNKMSKSLDNCIYLDDTKEEMWEKLAGAVRDTNRKRRGDPGNPDVCNMFTMHKAFSSKEDQDYCDRECRKAGIGCLDCKKILNENMVRILTPVQERQKDLRQRQDFVYGILKEGYHRAKEIAVKTMDEVYQKIGISKFHRF